MKPAIQDNIKKYLFKKFTTEARKHGKNFNRARSANKIFSSVLPCFRGKYLKCFILSSVILSVFLLRSTPAAAPPSMSGSESLYKAEGAHFEVNMDRWEVAAELKDEQGNSYYLTFNFFRSGTMTFQYRHGMAGLYISAEDRYIHRTFAPVIFARAAGHELKKDAERNPSEAAKLKEAAQRIENDEYRNFLPLVETPAVYRNQLFIEHEKVHFKRLSKKELVYSLLAPVGKNTVVSLKMESLADPVVFDMKKALINKVNNQLQGYIFPDIRFEGVITKGKKEIKVTGRGVYSHLFGNPSPGWLKNYREIFIDLGNGRHLLAYVFISIDGTPLGNRAFIVEPGGGERAVKNLVLTQSGEWTSGLSRLKYPETMEIVSDTVKGKVKILSRKTEEHLLEGRGAYFFGPCAFKGKVEGSEKETEGRGFCRMVVPGQ